MFNILFICHGNICRSPMAEFVLKELVSKKGLSASFHIKSCATSREEIGNPVHHGTKQKLKALGIACHGKTAVQLRKADYTQYDYLLCMDQNNVRNTLKIIENDSDNKLFRLLDFTQNPRDISDPWYTGNFDDTLDDVIEGCEAFLNTLNI